MHFVISLLSFHFENYNKKTDKNKQKVNFVQKSSLEKAAY